MSQTTILPINTASENNESEKNNAPVPLFFSLHAVIMSASLLMSLSASSASLSVSASSSASLSVPDPEGTAKRVVERGLNVRDVERLAQDEVAVAAQRAKAPSAATPKPDKDADTRALEKALEDALGMVVAIQHGSRGGELRIRYKTLEQLDSVCHRLRGQ